MLSALRYKYKGTLLKKESNSSSSLNKVETMNGSIGSMKLTPEPQSMAISNGSYKNASVLSRSVIFPDKANNGVSYDKSQENGSVKTSNDLSKNSTSVMVTGHKRSDVESYLSSDDENMEMIEQNMCASATGVVRVQSRRKAEMFLVRTYGFSCTREKVASFLYHQEKMNILVEPEVHDVFARIPGFGFVQTFYSQDTSDLHDRVDLVACLGRDGVILHASNLFRGAVPPVVSFNLGSLGFLTSHTFDDYKGDLRQVIHGNNTTDGVYITLRMRLRCEIFRNGKAVPGKIFDVLDEIVVDRGSNPYIFQKSSFLSFFKWVLGDGVIVTTPTGSTAYSTTAGGSMMNWQNSMRKRLFPCAGRSKCSVYALYSNLSTFSLVQAHHSSRLCTTGIEDSRGCTKQCLGIVRWEEKATALERRLCPDIYEPASTPDCEQVRPNG
ncbi:NAD kinase 2 [Perilla frutescens var. hirtella]|nr:NAD kinase 2 [Perilla frutescens var. hirtella]